MNLATRLWETPDARRPKTTDRSGGGGRQLALDRFNEVAEIEGFADDGGEGGERDDGGATVRGHEHPFQWASSN